jgi:hypothetical protein
LDRPKQVDFSTHFAQRLRGKITSLFLYTEGPVQASKELRRGF